MKSFRMVNGTPADPKVVRCVAFGFVLFGAFWLLVLSSQSWRFAAIFGSLGIITAAYSLTKPQLRPDQIILWAIIAAGLAVFVIALLSRA